MDTLDGTVLADGPEQGVAPPSGPLVATIDPECVWVATRADGWQQGEQGVIDAIVERLFPHVEPSKRWCVEFGSGDGEHTKLTCAKVLENPAWRVLLIDSRKPAIHRLKSCATDAVTLVHGRVAPTGDCSIDRFMANAGCPSDPFVMVVDVDSTDYHIVEAMEARPLVLCVETLDREAPQESSEPRIPTLEEAGQIFDDNFGAANQANAAAFDVLMGGRGYTLVFRTRFNSIYVRGDMVPHLRKRALNIGCGGRNFPGYIGIDIQFDGKDASTLDYPDGSIDEVYVSHLLEHFPYERRAAVLREWVRVLKPNGVLRIAVPDLAKIGAELNKDEPAHPLDYLEKVVYGGHVDQNDHHRAMFTTKTLKSAMHAAGLGGIRTFKPFIEGDCANNGYSLNLEGTKRWWPKIEKPRITLVLSQPRFTFTGHEKALLELARKLEFDVQPSVGAFWDRDITIATQAAIEQYDPDFLMFSDYDSVFEPEDATTLVEALNNDPQMAAIGAVQLSRHNDRPLVIEKDIDYSSDITKVRFQHFGLTLIRREVFDELPQPWFWSVPGRDDKGDWDWNVWNRSDADITFWRNLDMLGFRVYQHNKVCIGHIIQCIKYPRKGGKGVMLVPIENYWRKGRPADVGFDPAIFKKSFEDLAKAFSVPAVANEPKPNGIHKEP